jgi:hypothetical protein
VRKHRCTGAMYVFNLPGAEGLSKQVVTLPVRNKAVRLACFKYYLSNVELSPKAFCAVPCPMSSYNRHVILKCSILVCPKLLTTSCRVEA